MVKRHGSTKRRNLSAHAGEPESVHTGGSGSGHEAIGGLLPGMPYAAVVLDSIRDPMVVLDADLKVAWSNAVFLAAVGLTAADTVGRALGDLKTPLVGLPQLAEAIAEPPGRREQLDRIELEQTHPETGLQIWRAVVQRFQVAPSERRMILLSFEDITHERRILRRQLQMLIDNLPGAFIAVDAQRRIRFVSSQVAPFFGYAPADLIGQPIDRLIPSAMRDRHATLHADYFANPVRRTMGFGLDIGGVAKDGTVIPLDIGLTAVSTEEGSMVIAAIHDLRPQKQAEELLGAAKDAAECANLARSRLLAAAGHDLRQPLQSIELLHGILQRRVADSENRVTLAQLDDAVAHMTELLDSLLEVNRLESGEFNPDITDFSIDPVLARACEEQALVAASKGLQLRTVACSAVVRSDRSLLACMVGNLLANAIKYTDRGKVLVGCRHRAGTLRIEVWDTGIGIAADQLDAIFEEFYRADRSDPSRSGLGLGLYSVQRFARLLGHTVEVRSRPGRGTMFALSVALGKNALAQPPANQRTAEPVILLLEDDARQRDTLRTLLEIEGYRVMAAATGDEALRQLRAATAPRPDIIIADYDLRAGTTGLQAISDVRHMVDEQLPAMVVCGHPSADVRAAIEASGLISVPKPVRAAELVAMVDVLVKIARPGWHRIARTQATAAAEVQALPEADIAVIDDETSVRNALRSALASEGYKVAAFTSPEAFFADPERSRFRCLVVDVNLPGIDGLALLRRLKQERSDKPVIFVAGSAAFQLAVRAMREGAADVLQKPVHVEALRQSMSRVLTRAEQTVGDRASRDEMAARLAALTPRERQVTERVLAGEPTKAIAFQLGISERTVEHHRHGAMHKMGAKSLAMLIRLMTPAMGTP